MKAQKTVPLAVLISLLLISGVYAYSVTSNGVTTEVNAPSDNFIGRIISFIQYNVFKMGDFTVYGREMSCDNSPRNKIYLKNYSSSSDFPKHYFFSSDNTCGGDSFFVNFYRGSPGNDQYLGEYYYLNGNVYVTDGAGEGSFYIQKYKDTNTLFSTKEEVGLECDAGQVWGGKCYVEIYCCSQGACESDSACGDGECSKNYQISNLFSNLGVCQEKDLVLPTYKTSVYQCNSNGSASLIKQVSYGDKNFCQIEGKNNYITIGGTTSGVCYTEDEIPCTSNVATTTSTYLATQISLTADDLDEATASTIMASTCSLDSNCLPYEPLTGEKEYSVSCKANVITKSKIETASKEVCKSLSLFNFKFLAGSSAAICSGGLAISVATGGLATPVAATICGVALLGSVTIGSTQVALESGCEIFKQNGAQGLCIAEEKGDFFKSLAFFDIDGNGVKDKTDGMIILFGGIAILFLVISMGGRK